MPFSVYQYPALGLLVVAGGTFLLTQFAFYLMGRIARRRPDRFRVDLVRTLKAPARLMVPLLAGGASLPMLALSPAVREGLRHVWLVAVIAIGGWCLNRLMGLVERSLVHRYPLEAPDNLRARRVHTKLALVQRIVTSLIVMLGAGLVLMTFDSVRNVGLSLFASAGIAGVVLGVAARPVLSNLMAGIQVAFTDPIRLDDVVVVEGEWGRIEHIGMAYVTVRLWDDRRLMLPLSYFIEKPFQNWTRHKADLLGTVTARLDYLLPIEDLRREVERIVSEAELWDGRFWNLQVTDLGERSMEVRILATATDAGNAWNLRAEIREKLVAWIQAEHPEAVARTRLALQPAAHGQASWQKHAPADTDPWRAC